MRNPLRSETEANFTGRVVAGCVVDEATALISLNRNPPLGLRPGPPLGSSSCGRTSTRMAVMSFWLV